MNQAPATESTIGPSDEDEDEEMIGEAEPSSVEARFPLDIHKKEFTIFELHRKWQRSQLRLQPEFQRAFVWPESKQIKLVESVLASIPLPVIYLSQDAESDFDVVDGQQRLTTLFGFMEGRLPDDKAEKVIRRRESEPGQGKAFKLNGLKLLDELNGLTFETLDPKTRRKFEDTQLICFVLNPTTSPRAKFEIFGRLNEGAIPLTPQELRNALFRGPGLELVRSLAGPSSRFRQVAGADRSYARMRADELVLRGIAFSWRGWEIYKGDLKDFLNESLLQLNNASKAQQEHVAQAFSHAVDFAERVFGPNAWQRFDPEKREWSGHISGPLVEVVSTAASRVFPNSLPSDDQAATIRQRFKELCGKTEFIGAILSATQTVKNVKVRMEEFEEICRDVR